MLLHSEDSLLLLVILLATSEGGCCPSTIKHSPSSRVVRSPNPVAEVALKEDSVVAVDLNEAASPPAEPWSLRANSGACGPLKLPLVDRVDL